MTSEVKNLILKLYAIGAIQFGSFTLKSGEISPIYIDLRLVISYPDLMRTLSALLLQFTRHLSFDVICAIPYAALPLATVLSLEGNYPMIMCRKEIKKHGTKKLIEGKFEKGQLCLLIEDVVTSGASILETTEALRQEGLVIEDAIVLMDREQGGHANLKKHGIHLHPVLSIFDLLKVLFSDKRISEETFMQVNAFLGAPK